MTWGAARKFVRNEIFHSDHCRFPHESLALCSQQKSVLLSLLLELHSFTQLRNCWLDLLCISWVKIMNVKEMTFQQCSILMLYDYYRENNRHPFFVCFYDEQRLIWKLTLPTSARMLSWNAPQKAVRQYTRNKLNKKLLLEVGKDTEKCMLCS